jgi:hypothetical protein
VILGGDLRLPARFDDDGLVAFDDERRPGDGVPRRQVVAVMDGGLVPCALGEEARA